MITGLTAAKAEVDEASEWTVEELKDGKPLLVYRFIAGLTETGDDNYKFSQSFEVKVLSKDDIVKRINEGWRAKKSPIDPEANLDLPQNKTAIVFYAYTGSKLGELSIDDSVSSRSVSNALKRHEAKNRKLCDAEIKRIEAAEKAQQKADADTAAK